MLHSRFVCIRADTDKVLTEENSEDGYHGFDDGPIEECEFARSKMRPKGYRWTCPGWL